jgi:hypothetical protein
MGGLPRTYRFKPPKEKFMSYQKIALVIALPVLLAACASKPMMADSKPMQKFDQASLPPEIQVPAGNKVILETVGAGDITYECRAKANMPNQFEWVFAGPNAKLMDRSGAVIGKYYGPPATWEHADASKLTGTQVAIAPAGAGKIPHQLVKANPATGGMTSSGKGAMLGVSYIQRTATVGGVAPAKECGLANVGAKEIVKYQADYIFWQQQLNPTGN